MYRPGGEVETVVRCLLDAMRNAHMRLVLSDPEGAVRYAGEARQFHTRLNKLFAADPAHAAEAGHVLRDVLGQRCQSLHSLALEAMAVPPSAGVLGAFVQSPLPPLGAENGET
jgi:hypothetical protein